MLKSQQTYPCEKKMEILAFMSNVKAIQRSWMCTTCCLMVIHRCAKFGKSMSKTKIIAQKQVHGENETLILRPKVKVTNACDTLSNCDTLEFQMLFGYEEEQNRRARTQSHAKNHMNLTLRSKVNVVSGTWMYSTRFLTDRQTESFLYTPFSHPWTSFWGGGGD